MRGDGYRLEGYSSEVFAQKRNTDTSNLFDILAVKIGNRAIEGRDIHKRDMRYIHTNDRNFTIIYPQYFNDSDFYIKNGKKQKRSYYRAFKKLDYSGRVWCPSVPNGAFVARRKGKVFITGNSHPQMYIDHLVMICQEIKRVLKKSGSFYLNLGDTYGGSGRGYRSAPDPKWEKARDGKLKPSKVHNGNWIQPKQLLGIPERVMIALQDDGWILRNKNVWHKLNSMPSSVKDRLNNTWEPVFHFVKARKYYFDLDAIREPHKASSLDRAKYDFNMIPRAWEQEVIPVSGGKKVNIDCHPAGKNPGDILEYDSKYRGKDYGQTAQGFTRSHSKEKGRIKSREDAKKLFPNDPKKQKEYINYIHDHDGCPMGPNPGDVITEDSKFSEGDASNLKDRRDFYRSHGLPEGHPLGRNPGDVVATRDIKDKSYKTRDPGRHVNPKGKNPGDITKWNDDEQYPRSIMKFGKSQTTESLHRDGNGVYHQLGKNPGDVTEYDLSKECGLPTTGPKSRSNLPSQYQHRDNNLIDNNPKGKNPGDVLQFDEQYWWNFILGRAHSNRFYKKAYVLMKDWMIKNDCFDYNIFYEWYRGEFEGKWKSGTLKKGKANYLSDEKRLPFPKPETRFLGDIPGDFWSITTQPFTGYNPDLEHFAVFPESLVLKPLKAACPKEVCKKCGKPKRKVVETGGTKEAFDIRVRDVKEKRIKHTDRIASEKEIENYDEQRYVSKIKKYVVAEGCKCDAGFDAGVVLDPFCGRGTVGKVAKSLGLHYILFDAKPEYCELSHLYIGGQKHKIPKGQSSLDRFGE